MTKSRTYDLNQFSLVSLIAHCFVLLNLFNNVAQASQEEAWGALQKGGHIALVRHTDAPGQSPDPPGFRLEDCSTQRNLSTKGKNDAARLGERAKEKTIGFEKILSSPWCRCMDTVKLMGLGEFEIEPAFRNAFALGDQRTSIHRQGKKLITSWKGSGNLLISTHGANILDLLGFRPAQGEMVVVKSDEQKIHVVGRIK